MHHTCGKSMVICGNNFSGHYAFPASPRGSECTKRCSGLRTKIKYSDKEEKEEKVDEVISRDFYLFCWLAGMYFSVLFHNYCNIYICIHYILEQEWQITIEDHKGVQLLIQFQSNLSICSIVNFFYCIVSLFVRHWMILFLLLGHFCYRHVVSLFLTNHYQGVIRSWLMVMKYLGNNYQKQ